MGQRNRALAFGILLVSHLVATFSSAEIGYEVIRLPISDQLPQRSVERLHIDVAGHLWIRTQVGYHRFDGNKLEHLYKFERSGLSERRHVNLSRNLIPTRDEAMWLLDTDKGLARYSSFTKAFERIEEVDERILSKGRTTTSFLYDSQGRLWLAFSDREIVTINSALNVISRSTLTMHLQAGDFISAMAETKTGMVLLLSNVGILLKCSRDGTGCVQLYLPAKVGVASPLRPIWITAGKNNDFYISTFNNGAFVFDLEKAALNRLSLSREGEPEPKFGSAPPFCVTEEGDVWIATMDGLYQVKDNQEVTRIHTGNSYFSTNVMNTVISIGVGEYLVGSVEGIYLVRKRLFENFTEKSGLRSPLMTSFATYFDEGVLLATFQGLEFFDLATNKISSAADILPGLSLIDPRVMAIHQQSETTWIGLFKNGLYKYETNKSVTSPIVNVLDPIEGVSDIVKINDERIAVATVGSGIHLIDTISGEITKLALHAAEDSRVALDTFLTIKPLADGRLVAGSTNGLIFIDLERFESPSVRLETSTHLIGTDVYSVFQSSSGDIWAGTYERGLYVWKKSKGIDPPSFEIFQTSPKLPSDTINAIEEDKLGMLWLSTNNGLVRLNPNTGHIFVYDKTDGLLANEFNQGASFVDKEGRLYFGGYDGFTRLEPSLFTGEKVPPPLRVTGISISKESVQYDPAYLYNPRLTLQHDEYAVDIEFSTMDVIAPGRSQYKYKLEGFDKDWVDNQNNVSATFTNLPPGDYVFRAIGANSDGVWNYDGISVPIRVLPAPWRTWWAITFYLLTALLLLILMKRYYDARLLNREAVRQKKIMTNTAMRAMDELQDQLEQEQRIVQNLRKHSANTIEIISESLELEAVELSDAAAKESIARSRQRLDCIKVLESSIYFHGDTLKVNLRNAVDHMFSKIVDSSSTLRCELVLANKIKDDLVSMEVATPAVVILHELFLNSMKHAFQDSSGIECLEVNFLTKSGSDRSILKFSDTGTGLPAGIDIDKPKTRGMRQICNIIKNIGGRLEIDCSRGTAFTIVMPYCDGP